MVVSKSAFPDPQGYFVTETHQKYNHLSFTSKQDIMLTMLWKPPEVVDCNRICVRETLCKESRQKKNVSTGSAAFFPFFHINLFWDAECFPAAGHQQLSERDRAHSATDSHCHFHRALHGATACFFSGSSKGSHCEWVKFLLTPVSLDPTSSSMHPLSSFKGSDVTWSLNFAHCSILCLLLYINCRHKSHNCAHTQI